MKDPNGKWIAASVMAIALVSGAIVLSLRGFKGAAVADKPLPSFQADFRSVSPTGEVSMEHSRAYLPNGDDVLRWVYIGTKKPWTERVISDHENKLLYVANDTTKTVTALRLNEVAPTSAWMLDPARDCVVNFAGVGDQRATVLRHERVFDHDTVVTRETGGPVEALTWSATDFHCLPVKTEARSGSEVLSTTELVAIHTKPSALFKIPASYDRVDVTEYARRKLAYRGIEGEAQVQAEVKALLDHGAYVPGFQIAAQFLE